MSEQIITKRCSNSNCRKAKPLSEFQKCQRAKDGHQSQCKVCRSQYPKTKIAKENKRKSGRKYYHSEQGQLVRKARIQSDGHKEYRKRYCKKYYIENPEKFKARGAVCNAVRDGRLPRPDSLKCHFCGKKAKQYHHPNYKTEHIFDVIPVCVLCHYKIPNGHRQIRIA